MSYSTYDIIEDELLNALRHHADKYDNNLLALQEWCCVWSEIQKIKKDGELYICPPQK